MTPGLPPSERTLYLVDVSSFIFRAFYAIRPLHSPAGEPVNAVYGVATMLARLAEEAKPEHLILARDSKGGSFRDEIYAEYKANRSEPPEDLIPQFARIEALTRSFQFPEAILAGFEADDLIATMTKKWLAARPENRVVIVTSDKDLMALASERVLLWDTMHGKISGPAEVREKFGVEPSQIRDYLSIVGDSSDNIPGIKGLGPKAAEALLKEWGTLEGTIAAAKAGKIPGKRGEQLIAQEREALLSQKLATLHEDVPFSFEESHADFEFRMTPEAEALLSELGFRTLIDKWGKYRGAGSSAPVAALQGQIEMVPSEEESQRFRMVRTEEELSDLLGQMEKKGEFGFDLETDSLNPRAARIVGISISVDPEWGTYIPLLHRESPFQQLPSALVLERLRPFLENPRYKKIGQNLKFDFEVLMEQGWKPDGIGADTMVAGYVLDPSGRHNMQALSERYLSYKVLSYEEVCGKGKDQITFDLVPVERAARYSAEDAWCAMQLWRKMRPELEKEGLMEVFASVDLPLVGVIARMEEAGIRVDRGRLEELSREFQSDLKIVEGKIHASAGGPLNLNSPKQVGELLFGKLGLPVQSKTKTGPSTDASVLDALSGMHEIPRLLLEYREISKLLGTYVEPLPEMIDPKTGRIHASFHLTGTATGRLSSSDPNLQNIPVRSERGMKIRSAFVPENGRIFLSADYSQIELRILAHLSGDEDLIRSFREGEDVHRRTAAETLGKSLAEVTDRDRSIAKAINFGLMYGKTAFGLAQELGIPRGEAKAFIDRYFTRYSGVKWYLDSLIESVRETGLTMTMLGRKRKLPEIRSQNAAVRANAERMAMNTPIQGSAADLIKIAMARLDEELRSSGSGARLLLQVHDELVLECPRGELDAARALLIRTMEGAFQLQVPLVVNVSTGMSWAEL